MAQILYNNNIFNSRSQLVIHLLKLKIHNKSDIADLADVTPQCVEYNYKKIVKRNEIEDYYSKFIEKRKEKRLSKHKRRR